MEISITHVYSQHNPVYSDVGMSRTHVYSLHTQSIATIKFQLLMCAYSILSLFKILITHVYSQYTQFSSVVHTYYLTNVAQCLLTVELKQ